MSNLGFNTFSGIVYLNLPHREDRKETLLNELSRLQVLEEKIHLVEPIFDSINGHRGCALGHAKAIEYAIDKKWKNVLILEDDFTSTRSSSEVSEIISHFFNTMKNDWDVFLVGGNVKKFEKTTFPRIFRVLSSHCAHAYVVNQHYFNTLLQFFLDCHEQMRSDRFLFQSINKTIDQQWKYLMSKDRWYLMEIIGQQGASFSDIEKLWRNRSHKEVYE